MMRIFCSCLVVIFVLSCFGTAWAQRRSQTKGGVIQSNPLAALIDENNDGVLSAREIRLAGNAIRKLDTNGDGKITEDELVEAEDQDSSAGESNPRSTRSEQPRVAERARGTETADARPSEQRKAMDTAINQAAKFYRQKKYDEAGKALRAALDALEQIDVEELTEISSSIQRLQRAHQLLTTQGVDLPKLPDLELATKRTAALPLAQTPPSETRASTDSPAEAVETAEGGISFTKQIAPIFVKRCSGCHIDKKEGKFSLASYADMMNGSAGGAILAEGDAANSVIFDLVETGEMPPKGGPIPQNEIQLLADWVDQGAKFDGENQSDPIKK